MLAILESCHIEFLHPIARCLQAFVHSTHLLHRESTTMLKSDVDDEERT